MMIEIGKRYVFNYPDFGTPCGYPDYAAHSGSTVWVVRRLAEGVEYEDPSKTDADAAPDAMFEVRAEDGWTGHAWESELDEVQA